MALPVPHIHMRHAQPRVHSQAATKPAPRPFHESVIDVIRITPVEGIPTLAKVIETTVIKANFTEIILAWGQRLHELKIKNDYGVTISVDDQRLSKKVVPKTA